LATKADPLYIGFVERIPWNRLAPATVFETVAGLACASPSSPNHSVARQILDACCSIRLIFNGSHAAATKVCHKLPKLPLVTPNTLNWKMMENAVGFLGKDRT
jgi:hypothetical protein